MYILKHWFPMITADHRDAEHLERIIDMYVSFAMSGNPNNRAPGSHVLNVDWIPFDNFRENYLDIGKEFLMRNQLFMERYRVWESIFPMKYP